MASTVSLGNISISSQQLEWNAVIHHRHRKPTEYFSSFSADNNSDSTGSRFNLAVEASENKSTSADGGQKITRKFNHKNDAVDQNQTLVTAEFGEQEPEPEPAEKAETWKKNKEKVYDVVQPESTYLGIGIGNGENIKKRTFSTFSVSLPREKIEADLLAMGGSKRSRRIKKRPKNVQRQLDDLFPGLRLKYITPDNYRVRMA